MTGQNEQLDNHQSHCSQHLSPGSLGCSVPKLKSDLSNSFWDNSILVWAEVLDKWHYHLYSNAANLTKNPCSASKEPYFVFLYFDYTVYIKFIAFATFPCDSQLKPDKYEHIRKQGSTSHPHTSQYAYSSPVGHEFPSYEKPCSHLLCPTCLKRYGRIKDSGCLLQEKKKKRLWCHSMGLSCSDIFKEDLGIDWGNAYCVWRRPGSHGLDEDNLPRWCFILH